MPKKTRGDNDLLGAVEKHVALTEAHVNATKSLGEISRGFMRIHEREIGLLESSVKVMNALSGNINLLFKLIAILFFAVFGIPLVIGSYLLTGYLLDLYKKSSYDGKLTSIIAIIAILVPLITFSAGKLIGRNERVST